MNVLHEDINSRVSHNQNKNLSEDMASVHLECSGSHAIWRYGSESGMFPVGSESGFQLITQKNALYVVYGIGDGEYLSRLIQRPEIKNVLVFEPSESLYRDFLKNSRFRGILENEKLHVIVSSNPQNYIRDIESYFKQKIERFCHAGHLINLVTPGVEKIAAYKPYIIKFAESFKIAVNNLRSWCHYSKDDSMYGLRNAVGNYSYFKNGIGIDQLFGSFASVPAVVVATGPSLKKSINKLKEIQNHVVIIACDTAVPALLENGIEPHFVCSLEREPEIFGIAARFRQQKNSTYVVPSTIDPRVPIQHEGPVLRIGRDTGFDAWMYPDQKRYFLGQTVSQMCLTVSYILGCKKIYMMGVDCAFDPVTDQSHHDSAGSHLNTHSEWIKNDSHYSVFMAEGHDGQPKKTWTIWYVDSVIMSEMIESYGLEAYRVTPKEFGIVIQGATQLEPDSLQLKMQNEIDVSEKVTRNLKQLSHKKVSTDIMTRTIEDLAALKNHVHSIRMEMTEFYYHCKPSEVINHSRYDDYFNHLAEERLKICYGYNGVYLNVIHNILQGVYAETGYLIEWISSQEKNPYDRIEKLVAQYKTWFSDLLLWTDRILYLLNQ